ncbi:GHKL domain-containing protein [Salinimicrobium sp. CDJ15-81-2]|nr:GHKL domain-containing protein [Salinimicrobium nanhaiense]
MIETPKNDARQLRKLNFDLANYFSNTLIPQLFVDADLILRIFTPPAMEQFSLSYDHVGRSINDIKDNLRYPYVVDDILEVIETNGSIEKEVQTTDGNWFQMNVIPYVEHEEDRINGVIITFIDITRRLHAIKELEKLNSRHQTLMFSLSHDLRQPIAAITLLADALDQAHKKNDVQQFNSWIKTLKQSSKALELLVDDFTHENEEIGKDELPEELVKIGDVCENVLTALKSEIRLHKIRVVKIIKVPEVNFPKNHLRSIIYNLIHNAIKYRDPSKQSIIEIGTEKVENFIVLFISDNGPGIAEEDQKKVFEKALRLRKDIKGTGMGLYIAKKMVETNGGRIELNSKKGKGAMFKVFFKT